MTVDTPPRRSRLSRRFWGGVAGIVGAVAAGQLMSPAPAMARDYMGELILLCHDAGIGACVYHPPGLPGPANPHCPDAVRLNGDHTSAEDLIKAVDFLDSHCDGTKTTVVGHSIGAVRAENAARHFGRGYKGNTKFVLNAGVGGPADLAALPANTVMNCNYGDTVCDRQHGSVLSYSIHMPQYYPEWYDNNRPGFNLVRSNGAVERPFG